MVCEICGKEVLSGPIGSGCCSYECWEKLLLNDHPEGWEEKLKFVQREKKEEAEIMALTGASSAMEGKIKMFKAYVEMREAKELFKKLERR